MLYKDPEGKNIFSNCSASGMEANGNGKCSSELSGLRKRVAELEQRLKVRHACAHFAGAKSLMSSCFTERGRYREELKRVDSANLLFSLSQ